MENLHHDLIPTSTKYTFCYKNIILSDDEEDNIQRKHSHHSPLSQVDKDNKVKCISGTEENRYGTKDIKTAGGHKTQNPLVIYVSLYTASLLSMFAPVLSITDRSIARNVENVREGEVGGYRSEIK